MKKIISFLLIVLFPTVASANCLQFISANSDRVVFTGYKGGLSGADFTVEALVNFQSFSNSGNIIGNGTDGSNSYWMLMLKATGDLAFRVYTGSAILEATYPTSSLSIDTWYRIAGVLDYNSTIKLYIDGVEKDSTADTGVRSSTSTRDLNLNYFWGGTTYYYCSCKISDVRLWNDIRTPTELNTYKFTRLSGSEDGLIHYWKIDEGSGATISDEVSGSPVTGDITGADWIGDSPPFLNFLLSGTLKEYETDASGKAYEYLLLSVTDKTVYAYGTADGGGAWSEYVENYADEYCGILLDNLNGLTYSGDWGTDTTDGSGNWSITNVNWAENDSIWCFFVDPDKTYKTIAAEAIADASHSVSGTHFEAGSPATGTIVYAAGFGTTSGTYSPKPIFDFATGGAE